MRAVPRAAGRALGGAVDAADALAAALGEDARRQRTAFEQTGHRPFPLPPGPWLMGQTWADLLFAHWPVPPARLRALVPPELELDLFDGEGWISVTPFEVRGGRLRGAPPPPVVSRFPELNVRTYVTVGGRPGIWFFSLDAGSAAAVTGARALYRLPYFRARMEISRSAGWIGYRHERDDPRGAPAAFAGVYRAAGDAAPAAGGSLDAWLVERYRLYTLGPRRRVMSADIHHRPWSLRPAEARIDVNTMAEPLGLELPGAPIVHLAERQDVVFWPLRPVTGA